MDSDGRSPPPHLPAYFDPASFGGHLQFGAGSGGNGSNAASSAAAAAAAASSLFGGPFNPYAAVLPYPLAYPGLGLLAAAGEFGAVPSLASTNPSLFPLAFGGYSPLFSPDLVNLGLSAAAAAAALRLPQSAPGSAGSPADSAGYPVAGTPNGLGGSGSKQQQPRRSGSRSGASVGHKSPASDRATPAESPPIVAKEKQSTARDVGSSASGGSSGKGAVSLMNTGRDGGIDGRRQQSAVTAPASGRPKQAVAAGGGCSASPPPLQPPASRQSQSPGMVAAAATLASFADLSENSLSRGRTPVPTVGSSSSSSSSSCGSSSSSSSSSSSKPTAVISHTNSVVGTGSRAPVSTTPAHAPSTDGSHSQRPAVQPQQQQTTASAVQEPFGASAASPATATVAQHHKKGWIAEEAAAAAAAAAAASSAAAAVATATSNTAASGGAGVRRTASSRDTGAAAGGPAMVTSVIVSPQATAATRLHGSVSRSSPSPLQQPSSGLSAAGAIAPPATDTGNASISAAAMRNSVVMSNSPAAGYVPDGCVLPLSPEGPLDLCAKKKPAASEAAPPALVLSEREARVSENQQPPPLSLRPRSKEATKKIDATCHVQTSPASAAATATAGDTKPRSIRGGSSGGSALASELAPVATSVAAASRRRSPAAASAAAATSATSSSSLLLADGPAPKRKKVLANGDSASRPAGGSQPAMSLLLPPPPLLVPFEEQTPKKHSFPTAPATAVAAAPASAAAPSATGSIKYEAMPNLKRFAEQLKLQKDRMAAGATPSSTACGSDAAGNGVGSSSVASSSGSASLPSAALNSASESATGGRSGSDGQRSSSRPSLLAKRSHASTVAPAKERKGRTRPLAGVSATSAAAGAGVAAGRLPAIPALVHSSAAPSTTLPSPPSPLQPVPPGIELTGGSPTIEPPPLTPAALPRAVSPSVAAETPAAPAAATIELGRSGEADAERKKRELRVMLELQLKQQQRKVRLEKKARREQEKVRRKAGADAVPKWSSLNAAGEADSRSGAPTDLGDTGNGRDLHSMDVGAQVEVAAEPTKPAPATSHTKAKVKRKRKKKDATKGIGAIKESPAPRRAGVKRVIIEENLKKPLQSGWRRETRIRKINARGRLLGDVHYYSPTDKKLRSCQDVLRYLEENGITDLCKDNFSFSTKVRLGEFLEPQTVVGADGEGAVTQYVALTEEQRDLKLAHAIERRTKQLNKVKRVRMKKLAAGGKEPKDAALAQSGGAGTASAASASSSAPNVGNSASEKPRLKASEERKRRRMEASARVLEEKIRRRQLRIQQAELAKRAKEQRLLERTAQQEQRKMDKMRRLEAIRAEREMRSRMVVEARQRKKEDLRRNKLLALAHKAQERERKRIQALQLKASEARRREEERERQRQEKLAARQIRLEQKHTQCLLMARELRKPVEDLLVQETKVLLRLDRIPGLKLSGKTFADLLMVVEFCRNFGDCLKLPGGGSSAVPPLNILQQGLLSCDALGRGSSSAAWLSSSSSFGASQATAALCALVRGLLHVAVQDPGVINPKKTRTALNQKLTDVSLNDENFSEVLRIFLESRCPEKDKLSAKLTERPFTSLSPGTKASIMAVLCDELLYNKAVLDEIDSNLEKMAVLRRSKWELEGGLRRLKAFQKKIKPQSSAGPESSAGGPNQVASAGSPAAIGRGDGGGRLNATPAAGQLHDEGADGKESDEDNSAASDSDGGEKGDDEEEGGVVGCGGEGEECTDNAEELEKRLETQSTQHSELRSRVHVASQKLRVLPLGSDRFHRRYWLLPSFSGVFVEAAESSSPQALQCDGENSETVAITVDTATLKADSCKRLVRDGEYLQEEEAAAEVDKAKDDSRDGESRNHSMDAVCSRLVDVAAMAGDRSHKTGDDVTQRQPPQEQTHKKLREPSDDCRRGSSPTTSAASLVAPASVTASQWRVKTEPSSPWDVASISTPDRGPGSAINHAVGLRQDGKDAPDRTCFAACGASSSTPLPSVASRAIATVASACSPSAPAVASITAAGTGGLGSSSFRGLSRSSIASWLNSTIDSAYGMTDSSAVNGDGSCWQPSSPAAVPSAAHSVSQSPIKRDVSSPWPKANQAFSLASKVPCDRLSALSADLSSAGPASSLAVVGTSFGERVPPLTASVEPTLSATRQLWPQAGAANLTRQDSDGGGPPAAGDRDGSGNVGYRLLVPKTEDGLQYAIRQPTVLLKPRSIPQDVQKGWWRITEYDQVKSVQRSMQQRGIREKQLLKALQKQGDIISQAFNAADDASENGSSSGCNSGSKLDMAMEVTDEDRAVSQNGYGAPLSDNEKSGSEDRLDKEDGAARSQHWRKSLAECARVARQLLAAVERLEDRVCSASMHTKHWACAPKLSDDLNEDGGIGSSIEGGAFLLNAARERLISLEGGIERRYLKPPLSRPPEVPLASVCSTGTSASDLASKDVASNASRDGLASDEDTKGEDSRLASGSNSGSSNEPPGLVQWRDAVQSATSAAQLQLCVAQLNDGIAWEKSIMRVRCQLCRFDDNEAELLLCDSCDKGYHTYCFKPRMTTIPDGNWYCWECRSRAAAASSGGSGIIPHCLRCGGRTGKLALCAACSLALHIDCMDPPQNRMPRKWYCANCSEAQAPTRSSKRRRSKAGESTSDDSDDDWSLPDGKRNRKDSSCPASSSTAQSTTAAAGGGAKDDMSCCRSLLVDMEKQRQSWPFLQPVDAKSIPEYSKYIKHPMDMSTMKQKLRDGGYKSRSEFAADALLMFDNCELFNEDDSEIGQAGHWMRRYFNKRWKELTSSASGGGAGDE